MGRQACEQSVAQEAELKAFKSYQVPVADGRLNDSFWNEAIPFTDFKMVEPYPCCFCPLGAPRSTRGQK